MYCQNCRRGEKDLIEVINLGMLPLANSLIKKKNICKKYPLKVIFCKECKLVQTSQKLKREIIFNKKYPYLSSVSKTILLESESLFNFLKKKYSLSEKDFVIEVGSNDGYLLSHFKNNKIPCLGIEPSKIPFKLSKKKKINTINKFFGEKLSLSIIKKYKKANFIISNNTIAHVPDVNDFFKGFKNLLTEKGIIIFEFQYLLNLIKEKLFDNIYHEHYLYYSILSLENILKKYNLEIFDVFKITSHGGSLRVFVKNIINNDIKKTNRYYKSVNIEKSFKLNSSKSHKFFRKNIKLNTAKYLKIINSLRKKNFKIIGYGASAKATIFLNYLKLGNKSVPYVIDQSVYKQDKYIPGVNIPILSPDKVDLSKFDYILLLVWNIKKEVKEYINSLYPNINLKFISFFPKIEIK